MSAARSRHHAGVLLVLAAAFWWHRWIPALLVAGFVSWVIVHKRLEGDLGQALARGARRVWPPPTAVLALILCGATLAYWVSDGPITPKVMPIGLNLLALSVVSFGDWRTRFADSKVQDGKAGRWGHRVTGAIGRA